MDCYLALIVLRTCNWQIGQTIQLRGPLGNGFHIPAPAERIGLIANGAGKAACLLPLAETLLAQGKEVALVTNTPAQGLPMALEILPADQAQEVAAWADMLAFCAERTEIPELIEKYAQKRSRNPAEVFLQSEMPCAGTAVCGVCAVPTKKGWKLICKDGPVFALADLVTE